MSNIFKKYGLESVDADQELPVEQSELDEEIIHPENGTVDSVNDADELVGQLDHLEETVEDDSETASVEHYAWVLGTLTNNAEMPLPKTVSVESFGNNRRDKRSLLTAIREHKDRINSSIVFALEDYVGGFGSRFTDANKTFLSINGKLGQLVSYLDAPDEKINIDLKSVWTIFHVNGKFIKGPAEIKNEYNRIEDMVNHVVKAADSLTSKLNKPLAKGKEFELGNEGKLTAKSDFFMNNTEIHISETGAEIQGELVEIPENYWTIGDYIWMLAWGFFFIVGSWITAIVAAIRYTNHGTLVTKDGKPTVNKNVKSEMVDFVKTIVSMKALIGQLDKSFGNLAKAINAHEGESKDEVNRRAAPIIESGFVITRHVTDLTHGAEKLFRKLK